MFCALRRQYRAAAVLSHLAARDIMEPALKATVLCVPGSRGGVEVEVEVEVVQVVEVGQVDQEGLYGSARTAKHKKMANGQKDKMTK